MNATRSGIACFAVGITLLLFAAPASAMVPALAPIADMTLAEGATATQALSATDADGDPLFFQRTLGPAYMVVRTLDPGTGAATGEIELAPGYGDAAVATPAAVRVSDGVFLSNVRAFMITVIHVNHAPSADPGGPYDGVPLVAIAFDGTGSSDPDGDALTYSWTFGDLESAVGPTPYHAYAASGAYDVELTVSDGSLTATAGTTATIADILPARAFTWGRNRVMRLIREKIWSVEIEPIAGDYDNADVDLASIRMKSQGTGSVSEIPVVASKTTIGRDMDLNGIQELTAAFANDDLRALFSGLKGTHTVPVTVEGEVTSGGVFRARVDVLILAPGASLAASISPNPFNPTGVLTFETPVTGPVAVRVFDAQGRLVRTLIETALPAGSHQAVLDGRDGQGRALPSGVYFYRVEAAGETMTGRFAISK
jgi:PKD repeat protein